jgi:hypothetical protein
VITILKDGFEYRMLTKAAFTFDSGARNYYLIFQPRNKNEEDFIVIPSNAYLK